LREQEQVLRDKEKAARDKLWDEKLAYLDRVDPQRAKVERECRALDEEMWAEFKELDKQLRQELDPIRDKYEAKKKDLRASYNQKKQALRKQLRPHKSVAPGSPVPAPSPK
jgi:hypothetical protein